MANELSLVMGETLKNPSARMFIYHTLPNGKRVLHSSPANAQAAKTALVGLTDPVVYNRHGVPVQIMD